MDNIAERYYNLLKSIDLKDEITYNGIREGLNKFLSNAYLTSIGGRKVHTGDYYSEDAKRLLENNIRGKFVFEHMVPKDRYIQKPCVEKALNNELTLDFVIDKLKLWKIAIVTKEEDSKLRGKTMPPDWDGKNIFSRYIEAGIDLIPRDKINFKN